MPDLVAGLGINANEAAAFAPTCEGRCSCKRTQRADIQKIQTCKHSIRSKSQPIEGAESEAKTVAGAEWRPAGKNTGTICRAQPAPHYSDGGVVIDTTVWDGEPLACLVEDIEEDEISQPVENAEEVFTIPYDFSKKQARLSAKDTVVKKVQQQQVHIEKQTETAAVSRQVVVRTPNVRERRQASVAGVRSAFGIRKGNLRKVVLSESAAEEAVRGGAEIREFSEYSTLSRNIKKAKAWAVKQDIAGDGHQCCSEVQPRQSNQVGPGRLTELRQTSANESQEEEIDVQILLSHPQVSHKSNVSRRVRDRMDTFGKCAHRRVTLDLRGTSACKVQRNLRKHLVQDLKEGVDEAAFVCAQLGIDNVPRADQLELMIAAMPGLLDVKFEGPEAESGLDVPLWQELHATHCCNGCTATKINPKCYFKVVHHYLLRGYDPALLPGEAWGAFRTNKEAYIEAWNKDRTRCGDAWEKWKTQAAGLLSAPSEVEPPLVVPLHPAARSKHVWRYLRHGTPYKVRLCLDLKSAGVNSAVAEWKFRYRGLGDIAASLRKGDWLASVDISRFYLRLPAGRKLRQAQWVQDPDSYAKSTSVNNRSKAKRWRQLLAIGFGLKTAPAWASVVSAELVRILEKAGVRVVGCFLDDILIAGSSEVECQRALEKAMSIMARLGIPANEKTVTPRAPKEDIVFLGVHIRTCDMRFTISREHKEYAVERISAVLKQKEATKGELASIAGVLNWISFVFTPGRPRKQHIYNAARRNSTQQKSDVVAVRGPLLRQLQWWKHALSSSSFVGSRVWDSKEAPETMLLRSDASGEDGWGACIGGFHLVGPWPEELKEEHMLFKELVPVTIALSLMAKALPETVFGVAVDNTGAAFAVNKLSCRDPISRRLLQQMASDLDAGGHTALAAHVRRARNVHADEMSHALMPAWWESIKRHHKTRAARYADKYWFFPAVVQCLQSGKSFSFCFRMKKSLF